MVRCIKSLFLVPMKAAQAHGVGIDLWSLLISTRAVTPDHLKQFRTHNGALRSSNSVSAVWGLPQRIYGFRPYCSWITYLDWLEADRPPYTLLFKVHCREYLFLPFLEGVTSGSYLRSVFLQSFLSWNSGFKSTLLTFPATYRKLSTIHLTTAFDNPALSKDHSCQ